MERYVKAPAHPNYAREHRGMDVSNNQEQMVKGIALDSFLKAHIAPGAKMILNIDLTLTLTLTLTPGAKMILNIDAEGTEYVLMKQDPFRHATPITLTLILSLTITGKHRHF